MSNRRPVVYLAIIAAGVLLNFIYDNFAPQTTAPAVERTAETVPASAPSRNAASATDLAVYRTGWPELPAERADDDLYYTRHLFGADDSASVRNYSACYSRRHRCPVWVAAPRHPS